MASVPVRTGAAVAILFCLGSHPLGEVRAFQDPGQVRPRLGVREYLLVGVYDNLTRPRVPGGAGMRGLRDRGVFESGALPGMRQQVQVEPGHSTIRFQTLVGEIEIRRPTVLGFQEYLQAVRRDQARRLLRARFQAARDEEEERRSLLEFEIPITVPRGLERVVGEGGAGLRVTGNRNIRFSGKSEWTEGAVSTATAYQSRFPDLNMEQESRFAIIGNVGDKVEVSVEQDTRALTDLENSINIAYRGYDDEILQELVAGNTTFNLTGSQFVGFSSQGASGLFGVKGVARLGPLTFTALASQEKGSGEKATFQAGARQTEVRRPEIEPLLGTYYFLDYVYRDRFEDRIYASPDSIVSIHVFVDDQQYDNDAEKSALENSVAYFDPDNPASTDSRDAHLGSFHELDPGEYYINRAGGFIALNRSLGPKEVLGVVYETQQGQTFGQRPTEDDATLVMKLIKPQDPRPTDSTWDYEFRNVYYLGARNIPAGGFKLRIFYDTPSGEDEYTLEGTDYLEIFGLDEWGEVPGTPPDGNIDLNENYVNLARGELIFPALEPFMKAELASDPADPANVEDRTVEMYDTIDRAKLTRESRYYLLVEIATRSVTYTLPATNILEGSESVTLNGRRLQRGTDYRINYLTGELTFLTEDIQDPTADVKVDYEYSPLIQLEQKTLLGARAEYSLGPYGTISGIVLSRGERTMDQRIRLGREPNRTLVWDAAAVLAFEPRWLTRAVDALPGIETEAPSTLNIEAEYARSSPNPNTRNDALVDDFEGVKNSTGYGIGRGRWSPAAVPSERSAEERARLLWFNPYRRVASRDIWPGKETDLRSDRVNVLTLFMIPNQPQPWPAGAYDWNTTSLNRRWNGVQQAVAAGASDLTQFSYLELWVRGDRGELHVDMGTISEDTDSNGQLNSEDVLRNGVRNGVMDEGEDIGLDGLSDEEELNYYLIHAGDDPSLYPDLEGKQARFSELYADQRWYGFRTPDDPSHDNWRYTNPDTYTRVNGTEGSQLDPDRLGKPDSEDINRNGYLDRTNNYVSYVVDLGPESADSIYVAGGDVDRGNWSEPDSWRLYRIPLTDIAASTGTPDLSLVQSVRVWLTAPPDTTAFDVSIATIEIVGNNWKERPIEVDGTTLPPETVRASVRNTFDNIGEYSPPPGVGAIRDRITNLLGKEQSLAVEFTQLPPGVEGEIFHALTKAEDLTLYQSLRMFLHGRPAGSWIADPDTSVIETFLRFGADENNFYEYRTRVYPGWDERNHVEVDFAEITSLKEALLARWGTRGGVPDTSAGHYRVRGRPSLTNIRRMAIGVANLHETLPIDGEIWADELRVIDVRRDQGTAARLAVRSQLADVGIFDYRMSRRTADFHGLREKRGTLSTTTSSNLQFNLGLDRFLPEQWGLQLPLVLTSRTNLSLPKYQPGSDRILPEGERELYRTEQSDQSLRLSLRKTLPSESGVLRWTLDRSTIALTGSRRSGRSPLNPVNDSYQVQGTFGWNLWSTRDQVPERAFYPFRYLILLPRFIRNFNFNAVPTQLSYGLDMVKLGEKVADRTGTLRLRNAWTAVETWNLGLHPAPPLRGTYTLTMNRDLPMDWKPAEFNLGREVRRRQLFNLTWDPEFIPWLTQRYTYAADYRENNDPRFTTRLDPNTGELIKIGRNADTVAEATAGFTLLPVQVLGSPRDLPDATGLKRLINDLRKLAGRITPVIINLSSERTGQQYNLLSRPSLIYQLGLRSDPDVARSAVVATQQSTVLSNRRIDVRTGISLPLQTFFDVNPQWRWIDQLSESRSTFQTSRTWPNYTLRFQGLQGLWVFPDLTSTFFITTSFRRMRDRVDRLTDAGDGERGLREKYSTSSTRMHQPFYSVQLVFLNGIGLTVGRNRTVSLRKQFGTALSRTRTRNADFSVDISYRFSAPEGIKLPFFRKPLRIPSEAELRLGISRREDLTEVGVLDIAASKGQRLIWRDYVPTVSTATWSLRPRVGYTFSRIIEGGLEMRFEDIQDRLMDRTRKVREVAIWVNITFR